MKWFLTVCALAGALGFVAGSCGPQKDICPTQNMDPSDLTCHANFDAAPTGGTGGGGLMCEAGAPMVCPDPAHTKVCNMADCP
jgi:hypothetical protein